MITTTTTTCVLGCNATAEATMEVFGKDLQVCANASLRHSVSKDACDFCQATVYFSRKYDQFGHAHWLEGHHGSGSDHLAIWCGECGPKHRK